MLVWWSRLSELLSEIWNYLEYIDNKIISLINGSIILTILFIILYMYYKWEYLKAEKGLDKYKSKEDLDKYKSEEWPPEVILAFIIFSIYIFSLNYLIICHPDLFSRLISSIRTPIIIIILELILYVYVLIRSLKRKIVIQELNIVDKFKKDLNTPKTIFLCLFFIVTIIFLLAKFISIMISGFEDLGLIFNLNNLILLELWIAAIALYYINFFDI